MLPMSKTFRSWDVDQSWLLPRSVHDFVAPGHLAHFVRDTVREGLDLSAILQAYGEERGQPPYAIRDFRSHGLLRDAFVVALLLRVKHRDERFRTEHHGELRDDIFRGHAAAALDRRWIEIEQGERLADEPYLTKS